MYSLTIKHKLLYAKYFFMFMRLPNFFYNKQILSNATLMALQFIKNNLCFLRKNICR